MMLINICRVCIYKISFPDKWILTTPLNFFIESTLFFVSKTFPIDCMLVGLRVLLSKTVGDRTFCQLAILSTHKIWSKREPARGCWSACINQLRKSLRNFLWTSYELLMNFLWTPYELLMNFLWTSGIIPSLTSSLPFWDIGWPVKRRRPDLRELKSECSVANNDSLWEVKRWKYWIN